MKKEAKWTPTFRKKEFVGELASMKITLKGKNRNIIIKMGSVINM